MNISPTGSAWSDAYRVCFLCVEGIEVDAGILNISIIIIIYILSLGNVRCHSHGRDIGINRSCIRLVV